MKAIVEISKHSCLKYEYDEKEQMLILDRVLHNTNMFPYNYGFIPKTLAPDGDPVDILILSSHQIMPGCMINIRVLGGIETHDEKGQDDKIVCVLENCVDKEYSHIQDIQDLPEKELNDILYFLTHYKDGEENKFIKVGNVYSKEEANAFIGQYSKL
jgi:inorganic pyrophosphatase